MNEQDVLKQLGYSGWSITGRKPETTKVTLGRSDDNPQTGGLGGTYDKPTGNLEWVLSDGKGGNVTIVVKPVASGQGDQGGGGPSYQVVSAPTKPPTEPGGTLPAKGTTRVVANNGQWVQEQVVDDKGTWSTALDSAGRPIATPIDKTATEQRPQLVNVGAKLYSWDGTNLTLQQDDSESKPKDGDTRPNVSNGYTVQEIYKGGQWVTDPSVAPKPFLPQDKPNEGDTRFDVQNGYTVRQKFQGGGWVIDPTYPPQPYTTAAKNADAAQPPKEGDTRPNVVGGYSVGEVYKGGQWVTDPSVAPIPYSQAAKDAAASPPPKEGDTRPNVLSGYQIQEVYRGGQWVVDPNVAPKPFTPQAPTTLSAPSTEKSIVQRNQDGTVTQIDNPNYVAADPAGRISQLKSQAQSKADALQQQVDAGALSADDARKQFDQYWATTIEPGREQAASAVDRQNQTDQAAADANARANQTTAQAAGNDAVRRVLDTLPYRVGPGYGQAVQGVLGAFASGKPVDPSAIPDNAFTYQMPNLDQIAEQATAQALKNISPTAAAKLGQPMPTAPTGQDLINGFDNSKYQFVTKTTHSPDGTVTVEQSPIQPDSTAGGTATYGTPYTGPTSAVSSAPGNQVLDGSGGSGFPADPAGSAGVPSGSPMLPVGLTGMNAFLRTPSPVGYGTSNPLNIAV